MKHTVGMALVVAIPACEEVAWPVSWLVSDKLQWNHAFAE